MVSVKVTIMGANQIKSRNGKCYFLANLFSETIYWLQLQKCSKSIIFIDGSTILGVIFVVLNTLSERLC